MNYIVQLRRAYPAHTPVDNFPILTLIKGIRVACPGLSLLNAKDLITELRDCSPVQWMMTDEQLSRFLSECSNPHVYDDPLCALNFFELQSVRCCAPTIRNNLTSYQHRIPQDDNAA